jgi:hypothetical protein
MLRPTVFGFASVDDVGDAIERRLSNVNADKKEELALALGQAIATLKAINQSIPVESAERHLIANELEAFANGS